MIINQPPARPSSLRTLLEINGEVKLRPVSGGHCNEMLAHERQIRVDLQYLCENAHGHWAEGSIVSLCRTLRTPMKLEKVGVSAVQSS